MQLDGKIIAPTSSQPWGSGLLQWLQFKNLKGITILGKGVIDGQGSDWWNDYGRMPSTKPTALRFYGSKAVTVSGITIQNSARTHLKFDNCIGVQVFDIRISAPADSPNTDGIHLQNSQDVTIYRANLACGDDCISIQTGCSNVDLDMESALEHWERGGYGSVQGITFSNIRVYEVEIPIMIDQFYCASDKSKCRNDTSAVAVSGINYVNIWGTYTVKPLHFACSNSLPCTGLSLANIELTPLPSYNFELCGSFCWKAYGTLRTRTVPPIDCLMPSKLSSTRVQSYGNSCWV
uniref:Polygalacturonase n=1 Tax=Quercus lobata TaxID=97700 RepID=A0A7N2QZR9_QUELO